MLQFTARYLIVPDHLTPALIAVSYNLLEVRIRREACFRLRNWILRQVVDVLWKFQVDSFRDLDRPRQHFRQFVAEDAPHLFRRTHVEVWTGVAQSIGVVDSLARTDAEQNVVSPRVIWRQIMRIVGCYQRHAGTPG